MAGTVVFAAILFILGIILFPDKKGSILVSSLLLGGSTYLLFLNYPYDLFIVYLTFFSIFFMLSLQDIKKRYIVDWQLGVLLIVSLLVRIFLKTPIALTFISAPVAFLLLFIPYLLSRGKGIGLGDVLVFTISSIIITPVEVIVVFLFTSILGVLFGAVGMLVKKEKYRIPLLPFMGASFYLVIPLKFTIFAFLKIDSLYYMQLLIGK